MSNPFSALSAAIGGAMLPSGRISNVVSVPSNADLDKQIADIEAKLAGLPTGNNFGGLSSNVTRLALQGQLAALKEKRSGKLGSSNGIPPAPDKPGTFSNQVQTPLVGLDALTIPL